MRKLTDVIDAIIPVIPAGHDGLVNRLLAIRVSSSLAAPEMQPEWWNRCYDLLVSELGDPDTEWKAEINVIFSGESR